MQLCLKYSHLAFCSQALGLQDSDDEAEAEEKAVEEVSDFIISQLKTAKTYRLLPS